MTFFSPRYDPPTSMIGRSKAAEETPMVQFVIDIFPVLSPTTFTTFVQDLIWTQNLMSKFDPMRVAGFSGRPAHFFQKKKFLVLLNLLRQKLIIKLLGLKSTALGFSGSGLKSLLIKRTQNLWHKLCIFTDFSARFNLPDIPRRKFKFLYQSENLYQNENLVCLYYSNFKYKHKILIFHGLKCKQILTNSIYLYNIIPKISPLSFIFNVLMEQVPINDSLENNYMR